MVAIARTYQLQKCVLDMRAYDLRGKADGKPLKKAPAACYTWKFAKAVVKATDQVDTSYETAYVADSEEGDGDGEVLDEDCVGASGIKLPKHTSPAMATALRRIHQNLGHQQGLGTTPASLRSFRGKRQRLRRV